MPRHDVRRGEPSGGVGGRVGEIAGVELNAVVDDHQELIVGYDVPFLATAVDPASLYGVAPLFQRPVWTVVVVSSDSR